MISNIAAVLPTIVLHGGMEGLLEILYLMFVGIPGVILSLIIVIMVVRARKMGASKGAVVTILVLSILVSIGALTGLFYSGLAVSAWTVYYDEFVKYVLVPGCVLLTLGLGFVAYFGIRFFTLATRQRSQASQPQS